MPDPYMAAKIQQVTENCAQKNKLVSSDSINREPLIAGSDITLSQVLTRLYVHKSIGAVAAYYEDITESQIRDAPAFAATLIELLYAPAQDAKL